MSQKVTKEEMIAEEKRQILSEVEFDHEIGENFKVLFHKALKFCSLGKMECSLSTYRNMITFERPFFMNEVMLMILVLEGASPIELEQNLQENLKIHYDVVFPLKQAWIDIASQIEKQIADRVNFAAKIESNIPFHKRIIR